MNINSPEELLQAVNALMMQMTREQRKHFFAWIKRQRNAHDFNYPQGYTFKEEVNVQPDCTAEPIVPAPAAPVLIVPDTGIIVPTDTKAVS